MQAETHLKIDASLCGDPVALDRGRAVVRLQTDHRMVADHAGLVHGGFVFGLADYAAMLAVNDPNVVLGAAETRVTHPVREGDVVIAVAEVVEVDRRKHTVHVSCSVDETVVMEGSFMTFVLKDHVLEGRV